MLYMLCGRNTQKNPDFCLSDGEKGESGSAAAWEVTADRMRRYEGKWHTECRRLFPGCRFLELNGMQAEKFRKRIAKEESLSLTPVPEEMAALLKALGGSSHHISMSRGVIRGGTTTVTEGPLAGYEAQIRRIDRHKRLAWLGFPQENSGLVLTAGLEITEKHA